MNEVSENIQLLLDDILLFHEELERVFTMEKGIHDQGLLESAVHAPFQTFGGEDLFETQRQNVYLSKMWLYSG